MRRFTLALGALAALLFLLPLALLAQVLPELPRVVPDTTMPRVTRTIRVPAGDAAALQAAIDTARNGDEIVLPDRSEFAGSFTLRPHAGRVVIRSETVPTPGVRVTPATAATFATLRPVPAVYPAITTADSANGWRIIGIAVRGVPSEFINYGLVKLGRGDETTLAAQPTDIVLDRVLVDAGDSVNTQRCVALNGRAEVVMHSRLANCHGKGLDSQAIIVWSGAGPHLILDNHLEGAGQNIMYGGADPKIMGLVPADITIRGNDLYKPLSWGPSRWTVKAAFELKFAKRVLFEQNVVENHWADAQVGYIVLFQAVATHAPWITVQDVTMRNNVFRNSTSGLNILSRVAYGTDDLPTEPSKRILSTGNRWEQIGRDPFTGVAGKTLQLLGDHEDVAIIGDAWTSSTRVQTAVSLDGGDRPALRTVLRNNVFPYSEYGVFGSGMSEGRASLDRFAPGAVFTGNVLPGRPDWVYPPGNSFPPADAPVPVVTSPVVTPPVIVAPLPPSVQPVTPVAVPTPPSLESAPVGFALATGAGGRTQLRTERTVCRDGATVRGVVTLGTATTYRTHVIRAGAWVTLPTRFTSRAAAVAACYAN